MPSWPASVPSFVLADDYQERLPATVIRTAMDQGPAKVRRRFTAGVRTYQVTLPLLEEDEAAALDAFVMEDLAGGALSFDWVDPRSGQSARLRIVTSESEPPVTLSAIGGGVYRASMTLERLP